MRRRMRDQQPEEIRQALAQLRRVVVLLPVFAVLAIVLLAW